MEPSELLGFLIKRLEGLNLSYLVTGSMATIIYGEPRFTNDIDVVIELTQEDVAPLCACFPPPDFYHSDAAIKTAVRNCHQFNIIQPSSGLKIDVMIPEPTEFNRSRFQRRRRVKIADETEAWFASPEDVILKKLEYYREGGSEKHVRDILGVLRLQAAKIDFDYIQLWAGELDLTETWESVREEFEKQNP